MPLTLRLTVAPDEGEQLVGRWQRCLLRRDGAEVALRVAPSSPRKHSRYGNAPVPLRRTPRFAAAPSTHPLCADSRSLGSHVKTAQRSRNGTQVEVSTSLSATPAVFTCPGGLRSHAKALLRRAGPTTCASTSTTGALMECPLSLNGRRRGTRLPNRDQTDGICGLWRALPGPADSACLQAIRCGFETSGLLTDNR